MKFETKEIVLLPGEDAHLEFFQYQEEIAKKILELEELDRRQKDVLRRRLGIEGQAGWKWEARSPRDVTQAVAFSFFREKKARDQEQRGV